MAASINTALRAMSGHPLWSMDTGGYFHATDELTNADALVLDVVNSMMDASMMQRVRARSRRHPDPHTHTYIYSLCIENRDRRETLAQHTQHTLDLDPTAVVRRGGGPHRPATATWLRPRCGEAERG